MHTFGLRIILLALVATLTGCAMTYHDPMSTGRPPTDVAVLEEPDSMDPFVYISEVNGRDRGTGIFTRYILPPGRNSVLVTGNTHGGMYANPVLLEFDAKAGATYVMKYTTSPKAHLWKPSSWTGPGTYEAWIEDKATGQKVDRASLEKEKEQPNQASEPTRSARGSP